jgi:hypothetical protein
VLAPAFLPWPRSTRISAMHSHARTSAEIDDKLLLRRSALSLMSFYGNRAAKFSKKLDIFWCSQDSSSSSDQSEKLRYLRFLLFERNSLSSRSLYNGLPISRLIICAFNGSLFIGPSRTGILREKPIHPRSHTKVERSLRRLRNALVKGIAAPATPLPIVPPRRDDPPGRRHVQACSHAPVGR